MHFAVRVQHPLTEDTRFDGWDRPFPIIVLIRDQHLLDVGGVVEQIHGRIAPPAERFDDSPHRELDNVAVGMTAEKKSQRVPAKLGETPPPARDRRAGSVGIVGV